MEYRLAREVPAGFPFGEGRVLGIPFGEGASAGFAFAEGDSVGISFGEPRETVFQQIHPRQTKYQQTGPRQTRFQQDIPRQSLFQQITDLAPWRFRENHQELVQTPSIGRCAIRRTRRKKKVTASAIFLKTIV